MVLSAHDFGSHVSGGARRLTGIVGGENLGDSEIGQSQVAVIVKNKIFRLDVSVNYVLSVDGFESVHQTGDKKLGGVFGELAAARDVVSEIPAEQEVHD